MANKQTEKTNHAELPCAGGITMGGLDPPGSYQ